jgi:hypothetical protein
MYKSLEDRFHDFMTSLPHVERIDTMNMSAPIVGKDPKKSDYFWFERQIIVELKTLTEDPSYKVHKEMDKHRDREDYPVFYGKAPLHHVLPHLSGGDGIHKKIHRGITRQIEDYFRSANKQIHDTKSRYKLPSSIGLLTILNENIDIMTPHTVQYKVSELLISMHTDGSPRFPHIDYVWILFESHQAPVKNGVMGLPSVLIAKSVTPDRDCFNALFEEIQSGWARYNGTPFIAMYDTSIPSINFYKTNPKQR